MRLSVIKYLDNETVFYNPGVFQKNEDLVIFPLEFDTFYNEAFQSINDVKNIIKDALNPESTSNPTMDLEHIEDWINLIQEYMDLLIKFDVQTTLNSFNNVHKRNKTPRRVNEVVNVQKEEIPCLIGL